MSVSGEWHLETVPCFCYSPVFIGWWLHVRWCWCILNHGLLRMYNCSSCLELSCVSWLDMTLGLLFPEVISQMLNIYMMSTCLIANLGSIWHSTTKAPLPADLSELWFLSTPYRRTVVRAPMSSVSSCDRNLALSSSWPQPCSHLALKFLAHFSSICSCCCTETNMFKSHWQFLNWTPFACSHQ